MCVARYLKRQLNQPKPCEAAFNGRAQGEVCLSSADLVLTDVKRSVHSVADVVQAHNYIFISTSSGKPMLKLLQRMRDVYRAFVLCGATCMAAHTAMQAVCHL